MGVSYAKSDTFFDKFSKMHLFRKKSVKFGEKMFKKTPF